MREHLKYSNRCKQSNIKDDFHAAEKKCELAKNSHMNKTSSLTHNRAHQFEFSMHAWVFEGKIEEFLSMERQRNSRFQIIELIFRFANVMPLNDIKEFPLFFRIDTKNAYHTLLPLWCQEAYYDTPFDLAYIIDPSMSP